MLHRVHPLTLHPPDSPQQCCDPKRTHLHPFCSKFNIAWDGRGEVASFFNITFIDLHRSCVLSTLRHSFRCLFPHACYVFPRRAHRVGNWSQVVCGFTVLIPPCHCFYRATSSRRAKEQTCSLTRKLQRSSLTSSRSMSSTKKS